jgi:hypothetical protein
MISKEKWAEIKLNWQRYKVEYIGTIVIILLVLLGFWFLVLKPAMDEDHSKTLIELKTKLLQKINNNSATLEFSNEDEAKKAKENLKEISENDNIHFQNIKLLKNGEKTEIIVQFKSAK